ncbi:MAG TPA: hypothetical protein VHV77_17715 [Pirellulales bacterium]|nr:hypothetical protein [Pirellulales bacterium]
MAAVAALAVTLGCTRAHYRVNADREVRELVDEKSNDPRWPVRNMNLNIDPRSRYFDPFDPDRTPMPPDDPAAHVFMHNVAGKRGYKLWHRYGEQRDLQNPGWREMIAQYMPITNTGSVKLDLDGAVQLAYIHSPNYRTQLETLYLSALDVSTERFRFVTQFFGGVGASYEAQGPVAAGNAAGKTTLTAGTAAGAVPNFGVGAVTTGNDPTQLQFQRNFATGGQLLVGFANSFVWQFAGGESDMTTSLLNFNFVQPLLRAGGRAVVLEQLTLVERILLANLRAMVRYRQGFYSSIAVGFPAIATIAGPSRAGGLEGGTGLSGFTGQGTGGLSGVGQALNFGGTGGIGTGGGVASGGGAAGSGFAVGGVGQIGGFVGLLQQLQQIRNTEDSLNLQLRTLKLLEANLDAGVIDITQVDTFRQNIESVRANLLNLQVAFGFALDTFKIGTLGLPPDLPIELDDSIIEQFRFLDPRTRAVANHFDDFIEQLTSEEGDPSIERLRQACDELQALRPEVEGRFEKVDEDLRKFELVKPSRLESMKPKEQAVFEQDMIRLREALADLQHRFDASAGDVDQARGQIAEATRGKSADAIVALAGSLRSLVNELTLVQARARLESVVVDPIALDSIQALQIARQCRQDWMNNRALVVNTWRLITYNANALRSNLTVGLSGNLGTIRNNIVSFSPSNGDLAASLRFDPPFTRLLERNNYRQSLISYQQIRRQLIQFEDSVNSTLRQDIRSLRQYRIGLEIQRRAVALAVRRVDKTLEDLKEPPKPVPPGELAPQLAPTAAFNLLTAISDLGNAQNNFLAAWVQYYSERMELAEDLGVMAIDERGMWIDQPLDDAIELFLMMNGATVVDPIPPEVPDQWMRDAGLDPNNPREGQETEPNPVRDYKYRSSSNLPMPELVEPDARPTAMAPADERAETVETPKFFIEAAPLVPRRLQPARQHESPTPPSEASELPSPTSSSSDGSTLRLKAR